MIQAAVLAVLAAACSHTPAVQQSGSEIADRCRTAYAEFDEKIARAGVRDAGAKRVRGFPYLRTTRFLSSFRDEVSDTAKFDIWVAHLREHDRAARRAETAALAERHAGDLLAQTDRCGDALATAELSVAGNRDALIGAATPPKHYSTAKRALGLYPLTRIGASIGYSKWKKANLASFNPAIDPPTNGTLITYGVTQARASADTAAIIAVRRDALGIPTLHPDARFLDRHAPVIVVDEVTPDDQVGRPIAVEGGAGNGFAVDPSDPVMFTHISHTRFAGEVLVQLNYHVWFPARPKDAPGGGLLGGKFDGLIWRVTLDRDLQPILYDTIHPCGCYHLFFPTKRLEWRDNDGALEDGTTIAAIVEPPGAGERMIVQLSAGDHYVVKVAASMPPLIDKALTLAPYAGLRALHTSGGGARFFGEDGIVKASKRGERHILWPMGIKSAGAMRQVGTHATAFVGQRHFDDAHLLDHAFVRASVRANTSAELSR